MTIDKVTFELSYQATQRLRQLKRDLEEEGLPVKQRDIVEHLLLSAKPSALSKHFSSMLDRRIGKDILAVREARRAAYKRKVRANRKRR